jgi:hypothetical protein
MSIFSCPSAQQLHSTGGLHSPGTQEPFVTFLCNKASCTAREEMYPEVPADKGSMCGKALLTAAVPRDKIEWTLSTSNSLFNNQPNSHVIYSLSLKLR